MLISLHFSPCSAQSIVLRTDALKGEIYRCVVRIHRVLTSHGAGLPFRYALPLLFVQDNSSLELSTQLRSIDFKGCPKSTVVLPPHWLP